MCTLGLFIRDPISRGCDWFRFRTFVFIHISGHNRPLEGCDPCFMFLSGPKVASTLPGLVPLKRASHYIGMVIVPHPVCRSRHLVLAWAYQNVVSRTPRVLTSSARWIRKTQSKGWMWTKTFQDVARVFRVRHDKRLAPRLLALQPSNCLYLA